ncbi:hypothetical protein L1987_86154 [Smallanthus sonchifolius]|uniref:Uncharacterized protein n=1 Tax=Smallanthus sonchifolius TaxID=185202 RepID=A0ACB8XZ81_9ASTR|nr:hypothetical protein L1987_86154 [Smallanthus sonchifolius]
MIADDYVFESLLDSKLLQLGFQRSLQVCILMASQWHFHMHRTLLCCEKQSSSEYLDDPGPGPGPDPEPDHDHVRNTHPDPDPDPSLRQK